MNIDKNTQNGSVATPAGAKIRSFARSAEAPLETAGATAATESETALKEIQAGSQEWIGWARDACQANVKAWQALLSCRTAQAAMTVQTNLAQQHMRLLMGHGRHMTAAFLQAGPTKPSPTRPA